MVRRRLTRAGVAVVALAMLAACGSGGGDGGDEGGGAPKAQFEGRGPVTLATGKDTSGNLKNQVEAWNKDHPDEKVRIIELPESADQQRQQMIQNAQTESDEYGILNLDVVWTAEFAANRWVLPIPKDEVKTDQYLPATVDSATYVDNLYAVPYTSDGALLYYRKDLLDAAGVSEPPKTWDEMQAACDKVLAKNEGMSCYAGQFEKYEGLTCNFAEAVNSAGGAIIDENGKPAANTPEAKKGLDFLVDGVESGEFPKASVTYKEEESRRAFQSGKLVFMRNWPYAYALMNKESASKVKEKFGVAPIPGLEDTGVSTLGGHNLAVSAFTKNKATALDFATFLSSEERQRANILATSQAPTRASLYDDEELQEKFPYLPILKESIETAKPRPKAVKYGDVTVAIQEAAYGAMNGEKSSDEALKELQSKLTDLIKTK